MKTGRRLLTRQERLLAAEASKALVAAPGAGRFIRVFRIIATVLTAAAQSVQVGVSGGTVNQQLIVLANSVTHPTYFESDEGVLLPENTALSAVASLAGPAVQFFVEYVIEPA